MHEKNIRIIWVGSNLPVDNLSKWSAASPAAIKWQKYLLTAIKDAGAVVSELYFRPDPYWPRGRFRPSKEAKRPDLITHPSREIVYYNFPLVRDLSLCFSLLLSVIQTLRKRESENIIVMTYNGPYWAVWAMRILRLFSPIHWVCVVADDVAPNGADQFVFLSYGYYQSFPSGNKMHLDGGVYYKDTPSKSSHFQKDGEKILFVYSGNFSKWGGCAILLDAVQILNRNDFEVLLTGPSPSPSIADRISQDSRVRYLGLLSKNELAEIYKIADVFINPRPIDVKYGENNFPSKLLDYLAWNKPILSTKTAGLSPDFVDNLEIFDGTAEGLAESIEKALSTPDLIRKPSKGLLTWNDHARRLLSFVRDYRDVSVPLSVLWWSAHPTSYNDVLFDALAQQSDFNLEVVYKKKVLTSHPWKKALATGHRSSTYKPILGVDWRSIWRALVDRKSYFIVAGWDHPTVIMLLSILKVRGREYAIWTDTPNLNKRRQSFKKSLRGAWLRWVFSGANHLLATGNVGCESLVSMGGDAKKVVSLPFFLDLELYRRKIPRDELRPIRFISSGRLENQLKGHDLALRALAEALSDYDGAWEYLIVGTGTDGKALKDLAIALGIDSHVRMAGWLEPSELVELYHVSDIVLHPSPSHDPYPNTVLEGMAAGCVVMASDASGSAVDRITSGYNGFLHSAGSWEMLADQIKKQIQYPTQLPILGARARATAEEWPVERGVNVIRRVVSC